MDKNFKIGRMVILAGVVLIIFLIFILQLMQLQIVNGSEYAKKVMQGSKVEFYLPVARGEILDVNGTPLVANRTGYNIQFYYAYLPKDKQNAIILELTELMTQRDEEWIDSLPITKHAPFNFLTNNEEEVSDLKKQLGKQHYATIDNVIDGLKEEFDISNKYSDEEMRIIAGVRYEMIKSGFGISIPYTFAEDISKDTMIIIRERSKSWPGVTTLESTIRDNSAANIAPHVIGNIGPLFEKEYTALKADQQEILDKNPNAETGKFYRMNDVIGKSGIELEYEEQLRGTRGSAEIEFDSNNNAIGSTYTVTEEPVPGYSVKLTIDADLQKLAYESYEKQKKYLNEYTPEGEGKEADVGAIAVLDVKKGNILALVSYPSYSFEDYKTNYSKLLDDPQSPLFDRALYGVYAPGSTYKPMMSVAGLTEGIVTEESTYLCTGTFHYLGYSPGCLGYHGNFNVVGALRKSCNIYYYNLGLALGIDKINEYATRFGLGQETGIEITEKVGHLASEEYAEKSGNVWNPGDVIQASIGQSYNGFTPLQIANYVSTIAKDGVLMKTHIVDSVVSYNGDKVIKGTEPEVISKMENKNDAFKIVKEGMRQASTYQGTAGSTFGNYPIPVASKTGTPQTSGLTNSVFICFAPIDDPQIAIAVVIEKGWHGYTGAPIARDIMNAYFFDDYDIYN